MTTEQPEALHLADAMERFTKSSHRWTNGEPIHTVVAFELRRLHTENETLRAGYEETIMDLASLHAQLEAVGAGGVTALMAAPAQPTKYELDALVKTHSVAYESADGSSGWTDFDAAGFASDVLQKWGQPPAQAQDDAEGYKRGYRDGYDQRDAEVKGAFA